MPRRDEPRPVEQYFAEFLSVLESRKVVDGRITSEALIPKEVFSNVKYERQLKEDLFGIKVKEPDVMGDATSDPDQYYGSENAVYDRLRKEGLRIPSNLIVIGTVNMDETTHQFSRKVIDRAMTIEMNLPDGEPFMDFSTTRVTSNIPTRLYRPICSSLPSSKLPMR